MGLLTAVLTRALALHSRQGREPLRGNWSGALVARPCVFSCVFCFSVVNSSPAGTRRTVARQAHRGALARILAVGAEALPVTPSGGALFAS